MSRLSPGRGADQSAIEGGAVQTGARAWVVCPTLAREQVDLSRSPGARRDEAVGLARAIDLAVVGAETMSLSEVRPATYIGKGKVEAIAAKVKADGIDLVILDCELSPAQQRNLERAFGCKVIDRTGLILEIFGQRACTAEGALQVELAHLDYQRSRLVRSWTHLERQRGGFGFLGGPGESQIETDRRLIQERIVRIKRELEAVERRRALQRAKRTAVPYPIVALVGYTNAGKSTLFNRLTRSEVMAADMLFATLEEVRGADVIVHVRDISHADSEAQREDVEVVLDEIGAADHADRLIEVWNKIDLLDADARSAVVAEEKTQAAAPLVISAVTGEGTDRLLQAIEDRLARGRSLVELTLDACDGRGLHWLYEHAEVMSRHDEEAGLRLTVRVATDQIERVKRRFAVGGAVARQGQVRAEDR